MSESGRTPDKEWDPWEEGQALCREAALVTATSRAISTALCDDPPVGDRIVPGGRRPGDRSDLDPGLPGTRGRRVYPRSSGGVRGAGRGHDRRSDGRGRGGLGDIVT